jgi:hypothetical protein
MYLPLTPGWGCGDLRVEFMNDWFRCFSEINAQFENIAQQDQVNSRKQSLKSMDR